VGKEGRSSDCLVIYLDQQEEIRMLLHTKGKKEYVCNIGEPLGYHMLLPGPVIKVNTELQESKLVIKMAQSFRNKGVATPLNKEYHSAL
jgi:hypothetical protein